jgi:hypothetical protein
MYQFHGELDFLRFGNDTLLAHLVISPVRFYFRAPRGNAGCLCIYSVGAMLLQQSGGMNPPGQAISSTG